MKMSDDLTGKIFGVLRVLHKSNKKTKTGTPYWRVQCTCGRQKDMTISGLHHSRRCTCRNNKRLHVHVLDTVTGQQYDYSSINAAAVDFGYNAMTFYEAVTTHPDRLIGNRLKVYKDHMLQLYDCNNSLYYFDSYKELANYVGVDSSEVKRAILQEGTVGPLATTKEKATEAKINTKRIIGDKAVYMPDEQWYLHQRWI